MGSHTVRVPPYLDLAAISQLPTHHEEAQTTIDDKIRDLEGGIDHLHGLIRSWNTHRNTLSLISRLPKELLGQVFVHLRDMVVPERILGPYAVVESNNRWILVTRVCKYWRDVAFACKELWAVICIANNGRPRTYGASVTLDELQAQISWPVPVELRASTSTECQQERVIRLLIRQPRIHLKELFLTGARAGEALSCLTQRATYLQYLYLFLGSEDDLPKDLFGGETPSLRELRLLIGGRAIAWDAGIFHGGNLTHLSLSLAQSIRPSMKQLQAVLISAAATLHTLVLNSVAGLRSQLDERDEPYLAKLARLDVRGEVPSLGEFLRLIRIPQSARIKMFVVALDQLVPLRTRAERMASATTMNDRFLELIASLSVCRASPLEFKRLCILSEPYPAYLRCN
ncbi:hypothetical protein NMY22_g6743 [Coprinellus aureogranulatus]|nr:hypothetical protein NMY22_g6743 [Coprinellus aureogranulatus]